MCIRDRYRNGVKAGNQLRVHEKIKKLESVNNVEIYLKRRFKEAKSGIEISNIEQLFSHDQTLLLKGEAGAGKSSFAAKVVQQWAEGKLMKDITCFFMLGAGGDEKIPLFKLVWDKFVLAQNWKLQDFENMFQLLQNLADEGKLAFIIDGLDELGAMTKQELDSAERAAFHPSMEVNMKTLCAGILAKTIFPGSRVVATGRNTELINSDVLNNQGLMYELVELSNSDRAQMVELMEQDPEERRRVK